MHFDAALDVELAMETSGIWRIENGDGGSRGSSRAGGEHQNPGKDSLVELGSC